MIFCKRLWCCLFLSLKRTCKFPLVYRALLQKRPIIFCRSTQSGLIHTYSVKYRYSLDHVYIQRERKRERQGEREVFSDAVEGRPTASNKRSLICLVGPHHILAILYISDKSLLLSLSFSLSPYICIFWLTAYHDKIVYISYFSS